LAKRFRTASLLEEVYAATELKPRLSLFKRLMIGRETLEMNLRIETLRRELSDLCHRAGLVGWEPLVKTIFDWIADSRGEERARRIELVSKLIEQIKKQAALIEKSRRLKDQPEADAARKGIQESLRCFVEGLAVKFEIEHPN